jgi:hypothetical protein
MFLFKFLITPAEEDVNNESNSDSSELSISSGIEKNLNFLKDDADDKNINEHGELSNASPDVDRFDLLRHLSDEKRFNKRFSLDNLSYQINILNSSPIKSPDLLPQTVTSNKNNLMTNLSEFTTNSDYSHGSGVSSNPSTYSNKKFANSSNLLQVTENGITSINLNSGFVCDRRNSFQPSPNLLDAYRDMVRPVYNSKSARNSQDFTNFPFPMVMNLSYTILDDNYIIENVLMLLKDQNGCRLLQKRLEEKPIQFVQPIFERIKGSLVEIINDQFGNYVIQKIIEYIYNDKILITQFFERIKNKLFDISINLCGTRVLQKLLDYLCIGVNFNEIENKSINEIFKSFVQEHIYDLIMDTNGNHVFQKILTIYHKSDNQFIYDELLKVGIDIALTKKGGSVFQRALDKGSTGQKVKFKII